MSSTDSIDLIDLTHQVHHSDGIITTKKLTFDVKFKQKMHEIVAQKLFFSVGPHFG